ncbi:unnamed protein product [Sphagnum jensenii]
MASSIGEVLDIESLDSYIKRPAGPMVTVEVRDISKLAGIIGIPSMAEGAGTGVGIPSMAEGAGTGDTTAQRILYFGLSNQCRKCRKFGHMAKICPLNRSPAQGGGIPAKAPPDRIRKTAPKKTFGAQRWSSTNAITAGNQLGKDRTHPAKGNPNSVEEAGRRTHHLEEPKHRWSSTNAITAGNQLGKDRTHPAKGNPNSVEEAGRRTHHLEEPKHVASKNLAPRGGAAKEGKMVAPPPAHALGLDQEMAEHIASSPYLLKRTQQGTSPLSNHESTPKARLNFGIIGPAITPVDGKTASDNPFAETSEEAHRTDCLQKLNEDLRGGWTFQGRKKLPIRIVSPRQDPT